MKKSKGVAIIAIILACLIGLGYYTSTIMSATSTSQKKTDNKTEAEGIKLGLDLSGGVSITYRIKDKNPSKKDINDTVAKLEERAESYSTEYAVYPVGDDRITVEIPGVYDANAVLRIWEARDRCILSYRKIRTVMKTTVMTVPQGNTN